MLRLDLGPSLQYRDYTVTELIMTGFPVSLKLGSAAMSLALLVGDFLAAGGSGGGLAMPSGALAQVDNSLFQLNIAGQSTTR